MAVYDIIKGNEAGAKRFGELLVFYQSNISGESTDFFDKEMVPILCQNANTIVDTWNVVYADFAFTTLFGELAFHVALCECYRVYIRQALQQENGFIPPSLIINVCI